MNFDWAGCAPLRSGLRMPTMGDSAHSDKIVITGGAGFLGRNLVPRLVADGHSDITVLDVNGEGMADLRQRFPRVRVVEADLANNPEAWRNELKDAAALLTLHAQIGGHDDEIFLRNNCRSTEHVLAAAKEFGIPYILHISSSVIEQVVEDRYSRTKKAQEKQVVESGIPFTVLRPTLMFGHYNRNHFAWLANVMRAFHVMPVPGNGRYVRQPLFVENFADVIVSCLRMRPLGKVFMISGKEQIDYIDCLRIIRDEMGVFCPIVKIPYWLFHNLLKVWAALPGKAQFNTEQLRALTARDIFEVIDWEGIFGVRSTPLREAFHVTFNPAAARQHAARTPSLAGAAA